MTEPNDSTVNSTLGLSLQLYTPSSCDSLACLGRLDIFASVVNVRNVSNNVTDESDWQYPPDSLSPYNPCGQDKSVLGYSRETMIRVISAKPSLSLYTTRALCTVAQQ